MAVRPLEYQQSRQGEKKTMFQLAREERKERERAARAAEDEARRLEKLSWEARQELLKKKVVVVHLPGPFHPDFDAACERLNAFRSAVERSHQFDMHSKCLEDLASEYVFAVKR